jgi:glutamate-1-semialdehyde 2,1-aminomutase
LHFLKDLCEKNHIVMIFNEVKTGFRVAKGGAQQLFGVKSLLRTFAKALGKGLKDIMQNYTNNNVILYQGTSARNPVSLAAADVRLDQIKNGMQKNIEKVGNAIMKRIEEVLNDMRIYDVIVQGYPSMFQLLFTCCCNLPCNLPSSAFASFHVIFNKFTVFDPHSKYRLGYLVTQSGCSILIIPII